MDGWRAYTTPRPGLSGGAGNARGSLEAQRTAGSPAPGLGRHGSCVRGPLTCMGPAASSGHSRYASAPSPSREHGVGRLEIEVGHAAVLSHRLALEQHAGSPGLERNLVASLAEIAQLVPIRNDLHPVVA